MSNRYSTHSIPVDGGTLQVGVWRAEHETEQTPIVLAIHGVTSNHLAWRLVAEAFPNITIIAPDLRGRARSSALPAPYGMVQHGKDLRAVLEYFDVAQTIVAGHSMGGFVGLIFAKNNPELVESLLLIDGGLPIMVPGNLSGEELLKVVLGPIAERLSMVFPNRDAYLEHWKKHPAFQEKWSQLYTDYMNYDLNEVTGGFQPSTNYEAMKADSVDLYGSDLLTESLEHLQHRTIFLRSPLGLFAEPPGLFSREQVAEAERTIPLLQTAEISGINHYTIVMSPEGAAQVAEHLNSLLEAHTIHTQEVSDGNR